MDIKDKTLDNHNHLNKTLWFVAGQCIENNTVIGKGVPLPPSGGNIVKYNKIYLLRVAKTCKIIRLAYDDLLSYHSNAKNMADYK